VRLPRPPRPTPRRLVAALTVLGLLGAVAFLVVPVEVRFGDDPLLRFQPFSPALAGAATDVDCGGALGNLGRRSDQLSLYGVARDDACRTAAARRAATAVAATAIVGVLALVTLTGVRTREAVA
jgi:hypothetical protein